MSEEPVNEDTINTEKTDCEKCIFCNVIAKNDPNVILQPKSNEFVVIKDIKPVATQHFLVLSHKHIKNAKNLQPCEQDRKLLKSMVAAAKQVLLNNGCDLNDIRMGFHWPPFYSVGHMHLHVISPASSMSFFNRVFAFNPSLSYIFVDVNYVLKRIGVEDEERTENQITVTQEKL